MHDTLRHSRTPTARALRVRRALAAALAVLSIGLATAVAQPAAPSPGDGVPGVDSFHQVSPTIALSGNVAPAVMTALASRGVKRLIVLRMPTETGYQAAETEAAARAAGLTWIAEPFDADAPDMAAVDRVLAQLARSKAEQTVIACRTGQRASLMWYAKRVLVDGWDDARAMTEAASLGLVREDLKTFGRKYTQARMAK